MLKNNKLQNKIVTYGAKLRPDTKKMCRIAGIISTKLSAGDLVTKTQLMCAYLAHGGPDDEGIHHSAKHGLVFGNRRLAIIDLSEKGHQPMPDNERKIWITFNGEIYNYPDLKAELNQLGAIFHSDTDTEVIIQAYKCWGVAAFAKLRGMFAFALLDETENLTYLVRDSAGIKPLYYFANADGISFASEIKAFKAAGIAEETDENWPIRFLAYGHIPEPYTTLKNVFSLPKGHYLCWNHQFNRHAILPYHLPDNHQEINTAAAAKAAISNILDATLQRQLLADAPLGVFLSGGVDSSLLTLLAHRHKKSGLKTVSIFFDEQAFNERRYQNIITEKTGTENHANLVSQQDFEEALPAIINNMDMPTTDGVNSWFISKYAHQAGLKAVLSGLGGDELFGGYPSFKRIKYLKYLKLLPSPVLNAASRLSADRLKRLSLLKHKHPLAEYLFLRGLFVPEDIAEILNVKEQHVLNVLFETPLKLNNLDERERAGWFETNLYMQNQLLRDTDVMSMAHGLEVRVPFLDEDFAQTVKSIAPGIRFNGEKNKQLLIDSFTDLLPPEIWERRKMGFSFPLQQWMQAHQQINNPAAYPEGLAKKVIEGFNNNKVHWSKAFALYQLQGQPVAVTKDSPKKIVLLTLETFSTTGGIQKMTRTLAKVLGQIAKKHYWQFNLWSGYDSDADVDVNYVRPHDFKGFNKNRPLLVAKALASANQSDVVILSHINLAVIGYLIKLLNPKCQVWLIAHGIEVWRPLSFFKKRLLATCDKIISVSNFTKQKVLDLHNADAAKCLVLNNALDPLIKLPANFIKPDYLSKRYNLTAQNKVVFTLTRLASSEQYKGYEKVIEAIGLLKKDFPGIKYLLSGKYDNIEETRIKRLINKFGVQDQVIVTGYIDEAELEDHFLLADLFILPSKKEGFGIVFIEALACGLPVICGNQDGSRDAVKNGELGKTVNADSIPELTAAMTSYLQSPLSTADRKALQDKCIAYFNADNYRDTLEKLLINE